MLRKKIKSGQVSLGTWLTIGNTTIAEIAARAGYDWVVVDLEHSVTAIDIAGEMIRVIDLCGTSPLVRLTSNDPNQIKRVMDAGAHGIVVPNVNSAAEAARAVAATRYGPAGTRGVGLGRAQGYGPGFKSYLEWQKEGPVVIVQIEHKDALPHLDAILTVDGVDGFIIGPYDLSCSLGHPGAFDRPEYAAAMTHILDAGKRLGVPAGIHIVEPDLARLDAVIREGYSIVAYSVDMRILDAGFRQASHQIKENRQ